MPRGGSVHVVHEENPAVAVDASLPVWDAGGKRNTAVPSATHAQTHRTSVHADTHTHWEEEARPLAGSGGCHGALKEANARDGR